MESLNHTKFEDEAFSLNYLRASYGLSSPVSASLTFFLNRQTIRLSESARLFFRLFLFFSFLFAFFFLVLFDFVFILIYHKKERAERRKFSFLFFFF